MAYSSLFCAPTKPSEQSNTLSECSKFCVTSNTISRIPPGLFLNLDRKPDTWKYFAAKASDYLELPPTQAEIDYIATITSQQSVNQHWKHIRIGRITASMVGDIYRTPGYWQNWENLCPPRSVINKCFGFQSTPGLQSAVCEYGLAMEKVADELYKKHFPLPIDAEALVLKQSGLFMSPNEPWIAASPDFIAELYPSKQKWLIEVKSFVPCPNVTTFQELLQFRGASYMPYYYDTEGIIHARSNHKFYYQIQCQMYVTGLPYCDLLFYYKDNVACVRVKFDHDLWHKNIYPELTAFYFRFILPEMYFKRNRNNKPLYPSA